MKILAVSALLLLASAAFSSAQQNETRRFTSGYGVAVSTPTAWVWDSEATRDTKVAITELIFKIRTDGKIRLLNTGTAPGASEGYARVRLSVTSEAQFSQEELRDLPETALQQLAAAAREELAQTPLITVDKKSVAVTKTRADTDYWAYRLSYIRSGTNGPVRVEQYYVPFANRAVSLTLSYELSRKEKLAPILMRVWASLDLRDTTLWPPAQ